MSVSRLNFSVGVNTAELDRGLASARTKLETFTRDASKMREQGEQLSKIGQSVLGGAAGAAILAAPFRVASQYLELMKSAAEGATKALETFKSSGQSITSQGFTPVGAANLASKLDEYRRMSAGGFGQSFAETAAVGGSNSTLDRFQRMQKFLGAYIAQRWVTLNDDPIGFFTSVRAQKVAGAAGMAASAQSDTEAVYWSARTAELDPTHRLAYDVWRRELGGGF